MQISPFQAYPGIASTQTATADSAFAVGESADGDSAPGSNALALGSGAASGSSTGGSGQGSQRSPSFLSPVNDTSSSQGSELDGQKQAERKAQEAVEQAQLVADQQQIEQLAERDREVRAHEQAHAAVGGQYAGSPVYDYTRGPNGRNYASSGHVKIDVSAIPGDPEATLQKAQTVRRAALAPAEPSSADRSVAAKASQMAVEARSEIARNSGPAGDEDSGNVSVSVKSSSDSDGGSTDVANRGSGDAEPRPNFDYQQRSFELGSLLDTTV